MRLLGFFVAIVCEGAIALMPQGARLPQQDIGRRLHSVHFTAIAFFLA
ncbi:hypothetical protein [Nostoc sphaeroides]|uniref:Uncharacterized protein n=1 Tax=Nostoc sphaeroides CCNUC1 TaxID=2653204 RepID=A0A5P8WFH4_9NOSO|nr:hypothetical protein [Nostoc sphaeroides]QFS51583.1 hypothetical protein GXM_09077 [Nostoc sphaeroides CCNUC1]